MEIVHSILYVQHSLMELNFLLGKFAVCFVIGVLSTTLKCCFLSLKREAG